MADPIQKRINQYLEDTIGAERNFEKALSTFGESGGAKSCAATVVVGLRESKNTT
jgi:hypothetical protein